MERQKHFHSANDGLSDGQRETKSFNSSGVQVHHSFCPEKPSDSLSELTMVYFFQIRGGQCEGRLAALHLRPEDIICYVGRDKHENEELIRYGWPGDVWFHVDGLSSAHVYFRLQNPEVVASSVAGLSLSSSVSPAEFMIPVDCLPEDSVYDMMQICKDNSIAGCKLNSCKIVYTPHSNLKKTFDMEFGAVTYHDTKLCRYRRCQKDRKRVNELNRTKSNDVQVDFYSEMKKNERRIIESRKAFSRVAAEEIQYNYDKTQGREGGDAESGIDAGLAALEGVVAYTADARLVHSSTFVNDNTQESIIEAPTWKIEMEKRLADPLSTDIQFLIERGYTRAESTSMIADCISLGGDVSNLPFQALKRLYHTLNEADDIQTSSKEIDTDPDTIAAARVEEKQVLLALYEFDEEATFVDKDNESSLDVSLPVTAFDIPVRYHWNGQPPPILCLEVYIDGESSPCYPLELPVLAVVGGGLSEAQLRDLTGRLRKEVVSRIIEANGETMPLLFDILAYCAEEANRMVQEEGEILARLEKERESERKAQTAAAVLREPTGISMGTSDNLHFQNETERRSYAKKIATNCATGGSGGGSNNPSEVTKSKGRKHYDTGVSDQSLINDLFG